LSCQWKLSPLLQHIIIFSLLRKLVFINFLAGQFVHICNLYQWFCVFLSIRGKHNFVSDSREIIWFAVCSVLLLEFKWMTLNQVRCPHSTVYRAQISNTSRGLLAGFWSIFSSAHHFFPLDELLLYHIMRSWFFVWPIFISSCPFSLRWYETILVTTHFYLKKFQGHLRSRLKRYLWNMNKSQFL